ncbi:hypothetical protein [Nitrosospira sp. Is2]|nr:hypothetical protein [Nitrosospira sp. Is2]WON73460.1 hypothetical protein R5L00_13415 [Nitrosospira sp. Is2]
MPIFVQHAAGSRCANRIEMPDNVVQIEKKPAVTFNGHTIGYGIEPDRI